MKHTNEYKRYRPDIADLVGSIETAIFWSFVHDQDESWVEVTQKEIEQETRLTKYSQKKAIEKLEEAEYLEVSRENVTHKYRAKTDKLYEDLEKAKSGEKVHQKSEDKISDGQKINAIITLYKDLNPSYDRLYKMKGQRQAVKRMIEKFGYEKLFNLTEALPDLIEKNDYFPDIRTPYELERKLGKVKAFFQREQTKSDKNKVKKL